MQEGDKVKMVSLSSLNINVDFGSGDGKYAQLTWGIRNGYPRLTVFTDSGGDKNVKFDYDSMITAPFDYISMGVMVDQFVLLIDAPNGTKSQIGCYNPKFVDGQKTNEIALQATVEIGKDAAGVMYIAVLATGKKRVKFDIKPKDNSKWHKFYKGDDLITDPGELSKIYARSYIEQARRLLTHHMILDTSKETVKEQKPYTDAPANNVGGSDSDLIALM